MRHLLSGHPLVQTKHPLHQADLALPQRSLISPGVRHSARNASSLPGVYRLYLNGWRIIYQIDEDAGIVRIVGAGFKTGPEAYDNLEVIWESPKRILYAARNSLIASNTSRISASATSPMWAMRKVLPFRSP